MIDRFVWQAHETYCLPSLVALDEDGIFITVDGTAPLDDSVTHIVTKIKETSINST